MADDLRCNSAGDVPQYERCGRCALLGSTGGRKLGRAAGLLGQDCAAKLSHGVVMESVCGRTGDQAVVPEDISPDSFLKRWA